MTPLLTLSLGLAVVAAPPPPADTLRDAADVLAGLRGLRLKGIPPALLADARAVAVFPGVVKAGFLVSGRAGRGVVVCRAPGGAWGDPTFVTLAGGGVGLQAGVESADLVLVFRTGRALDRVLEGKGKLTLGAGAGLAAGPVGRQAEAGTDARMRAEVVSYSRARGAFAGVALEGAVLANDRAANRAYRADPGAFGASVDAIKARLAELEAGR
jgi:lipid-binding SYLF domain-containing protein